MRYRIRLNGTQDADLIALYRTGYPLGQAFADAARMILGGADITLPQTPPYPDAGPLDLSEVRISVTIPENTEGGQKTVDALERTEKGFRALVFRSCLRNALPVPYIAVFTGTDLTVIGKEKSSAPHSCPDNIEGSFSESITDDHNDVPDNVPATVSHVPDDPIAPYMNETETADEEISETPHVAAEPEPAQTENGVREEKNRHKSLFGGFVEEF